MRTGRPKTKFETQYIPVPESGCWLWISGVVTGGYGCMSGNRLAHRYSYQLHIGPIPAGMCVCHRCDVPCCVNPKHLFLTTNAGNTADKVLKGRQTKGAENPRAKLTDELVALILQSNEPCNILAKRYGVTDVMISYIKLGKSWKHVPRPAGYSYGS